MSFHSFFCPVERSIIATERSRNQQSRRMGLWNSHEMSQRNDYRDGSPQYNATSINLALTRLDRPRGLHIRRFFKSPDIFEPFFIYVVLYGGGPLTPEFRPPTPELVLQTLHDRTVHLADATFGKMECRADFLHRQLFVIVEDDNETFVAIETFGHEPH